MKMKLFLITGGMGRFKEAGIVGRGTSFALVVVFLSVLNTEEQLG